MRKKRVKYGRPGCGWNLVKRWWVPLKVVLPQAILDFY
jgi:hypothetical protein